MQISTCKCTRQSCLVARVVAGLDDGSVPFLHVVRGELREMASVAKSVNGDLLLESWVRFAARIRLKELATCKCPRQIVCYRTVLLKSNVPEATINMAQRIPFY